MFLGLRRTDYEAVLKGSVWCFENFASRTPSNTACTILGETPQ